MLAETETAPSDQMSHNPTSSPEQINKAYKYWRFRLMYTLIIGYTAFYIVRQNFSIAVPQMLDEFGYTRTQIGWVFSAFSIVYGFSKFFNGAISDKSNARYFMSLGLLGAGILSIAMGMSHSIIALGVLYGLSGWVQSMGWPPITRVLTHWYGPKELGTNWGICNSSHQLGSIIILNGGALLLLHYSWRSVFILPGIVASLVALFIFNRLRDTPRSLGLPSIEEKEGLIKKGQSAEDDEEQSTFAQMFMEEILPNKALWIVCAANFFVYVVRMGFFNWAPTFLSESKGISLLNAGFQTSAFELAGLFGGLMAGWLSDKYFKGFRGRVGFIYMMVLSAAIAFFWLAPASMPGVSLILMTVMGFLIYGPQVLAGIAAAEFGSHRAACAANGLTGTFGYLGGAASGVGVGYAADIWGWEVTIISFVICAAIGGLLFMLTWNKGRRIALKGHKHIDLNETNKA